MTSSICNDLAACLRSVKVPGDYFTTGVFEFFLPTLSVEGAGSIALPLTGPQAKRLIKASEPAPYGRGEETLIDLSVRRTWQINADRVKVEGKGWDRMLKGIVAKTAQGLGVTGDIEAELYKLLIYDKGGFFVEHRDTEKAHGMFATLIVALPSAHTGGELVVRHQGREAHVDLRSEDPSEIAYAAFYADCVHELRPITSGYRLVLAFNLLRSRRAPVPRPPRYEKQQSCVEKLLRTWRNEQGVPQSAQPEKLVYLLAHAYTPAELAFDSLKGPDAAQAGVLTAAAKASDCDLHLALLTVDESGPAHYNGGYRGRWDDDDDDDAEDDSDFEIIEISDRHARLTHWRRPDGEPASVDEYPCLDEEIAPASALDDMAPDEQHFHEATGNEGASFERTYRRAVLVLWPSGRRNAVLAQAGPALSLPMLDKWLKECEKSPRSLKSAATWQQAHELAQHVLARWPWRRRYAPSDDGAPGHVAAMLALLARLKNTSLIDDFISGMCQSGDFGRNDNAALIAALSPLSVTQAVARLSDLVSSQAARDFRACCALLERVSKASVLDSLALDAAALRPVAELLIQGIPAGEASSTPSWLQAPVTKEVVEDLFTALSRIDTAMALRAAEAVLSRPTVFKMDGLVLPAVLRLLKLPDLRAGAAVRHLQEAGVAHLRARIAEPLAPPADWAREARMGCKCKPCTMCSGFLADPARRDWQFKAVEHERRHVESGLRAAAADVDIRTDKGGRPYTLICTKNQASYERRAKQRREDLKNLAELECCR